MTSTRSMLMSILVGFLDIMLTSKLLTSYYVNPNRKCRSANPQCTTNIFPVAIFENGTTLLQFEIFKCYEFNEHICFSFDKYHIHIVAVHVNEVSIFM